MQCLDIPTPTSCCCGCQSAAGSTERGEPRTIPAAWSDLCFASPSSLLQFLYSRFLVLFEVKLLLPPSYCCLISLTAIFLRQNVLLQPALLQCLPLCRRAGRPWQQCHRGQHRWGKVREVQELPQRRGNNFYTSLLTVH